METQSTVDYSILDVFAILEGPAPMQALSDPAELRRLIVVMEGTIELLKANEQRMYPGQAPKAGRSRRNETPANVNDPAWLRGKVLRIFQRLRQPFTIAQLHGQYLKSVDVDVLEAVCDELSEQEELAVLESKRATDGRKYCLPSDVPTEPELPKYKPKKYFQVRDQEVGVYSLARMYSENDKPAILINGDEDLAEFYKDDSDRLMEVPRNVIVYWKTKDYDEIDDFIDTTNFPILPPNRKGYLPNEEP